MSDIQLSQEQRQHTLEKLQTYCLNELDIELGQFDAEFLLDFMSKELGKVFYNQGLYDAQAIMQSRLELVAEAIYELEKV